MIGALAVLAGAALAGGALGASEAGPRRRGRRTGLGARIARFGRDVERGRDTEPTAKDLRWGAGLLAASTLIDSAFEHFRGNYENRAMVAAPITSALTLAAAAAGSGLRGLRAGVFGLGMLMGTAGMAFHLYNVLKRPGGWSWNNLCYAAPLGAPGALAFAGMLGLLAVPLDEHASRTGLSRAALRSGRFLTLATAGGMLATAAEVGLLHFRGAFHNPAMYLPVSLPPVTAATLAAAAASPTPRRLAWSRRLLGLTSLMGIVGSGFHVWGVSRNMGGWKNWSQMLFQGPPVSAPPSFAALAFAGRAALRLLGRTRTAEARDA